MKRPKLIVFGLSLLLAAGLVHPQVDPQKTSHGGLTEQGKFRFYETKQIRGEKTYQITQSPNGELNVQTNTDLPFAEQEKKPLVTATLRTTKDFTPETFAVEGPTLLEIEEDTSITVQDTTAMVQDRGRHTSVNAPRNFFTMSGYLPVTVEMMLVRYWLTHGRPASIPLLPVGEAFVEFRGRDSLTLAGKAI